MGVSSNHPMVSSNHPVVSSNHPMVSNNHPAVHLLDHLAGPARQGQVATTNQDPETPFLPAAPLQASLQTEDQRVAALLQATLLTEDQQVVALLQEVGSLLMEAASARVR